MSQSAAPETLLRNHRPNSHEKAAKPLRLASPRPTLTICATYTAEPIAEYLNFWLNAVGLDWGLEFAGYRQVFQQLLDPNGRLARNRSGYPLAAG